MNQKRLTRTSNTVRTESPASTLDRLTHRVAGWLSRNSIDALRVSLGLVFLGFGILKFFPGLSPAESLAVRTTETLTFGMVSGGTALLLTAILETFVGITFVTGRLLRLGLVVLAGSMTAIMSPLVLFFTDLFPSGPTLEAQYVLKDIVLAAAALVVAARALGARLVPADQARTDESDARPAPDGRTLDASANWVGAGR